MRIVWNQDPLWNQQFGGLTRIPGSVPAHLTLRSQPFEGSLAATWSTSSSSRHPARIFVSGEGSSNESRRHEQELLRRQFFRDPALWWDNRRDKRSSRSADLRGKGPDEVLWLKHLYKPAWVDSLDSQMGCGSPPSKSRLPDMPDLGRPGGHEMGVAAVSVSTICQQGKLNEAIEVLARDGSSSEGGCQEQELSWRPDPTLLWDNMHYKKSFRSPDFRREGMDRVLCVNDKYKPAWVHEQLVVLDIQMARAPKSKLSLLEKLDHGRRTGYVSTLYLQGKLTERVEALEVLAQAHCPISKSLVFAVLKQCVAKKDLVLGRRVHALIVKTGYESDTFLSNHILRMYASHARLQEAMYVFMRVATPDAFMWSSIISAHVKHGEAKQAIQLYHQMRNSSVKPDGHVFVAALQACARGADLETGLQAHADVLASGIEPDLFVVSCLVDMYAKCDSMKDAQALFDRLPEKDLVTWTAMIAGYAKCGSLQDAQSLFDRLPHKNVVTWTAMIAGYCQQGLGLEALHLYSAMGEEGISTPNSVTFACLLQACASVGTTAMEKGKQLHAQIAGQGLEADVVVGGSLVNMYAKCGSLEDARTVFDRLPEKNVVTWNAMIAGYSQQRMGKEALHLYSAMQKDGIVAPNSVTFACLLQACATVAALPLGKQLHAQIVERGLQGDLVVGNNLVNMYAKCGSMVDAQQVFDGLAGRDIVAWGALIAGYSCQGDSEVVFALVDRMTKDDIQPDSVTFLSVLTVCSHTGLVRKGQEYFEAMTRKYGITPSLDHYTCMVDLLGRAGQLEEALAVVRTMPVQANDVVWQALLGSCRKWRNVELGRHAFDEVVKLDEKAGAAYVMMSNIYRRAQMWEEAQEIQARRKEIGALKQPGESWWTDPTGRVHSFSVGDKKHPESEGIYARLEKLVPKMKKEGYVPHLDSSLRGRSEVKKEAQLCEHSEKLAIAYALNKTPEGTTIRIVKNLRVCDDCHMATAYISKIEKRTIICRDASRFHVYKEGKCSCGDYW